MSNNTPGSENPVATVTEASVITPPPTIVTVDTLSLQVALTKYVKVIANQNVRLIVQGTHAKANPGYMSTLLSALGVQAAEAV